MTLHGSRLTTLVRFAARAATSGRGISASAASLRSQSVSGEVYAAAEAGSPVVELFTKANCPLCDEAKAVLRQCAVAEPHTLVAVDITDRDNRHWWSRYKYDIPVLRLDGAYWAKHRLEPDDCIRALRAARAGSFTAPPGEPNAQEQDEAVRGRRGAG